MLMATERPELLTAAEAAQLLRISASTVRRWVGLGLLPAVRHPSGGIRVRREDVEKLLKREDE